MSTYAVANVYNAETNTTKAQTVELSHSLPILGTGDILTATSNVITGTGTTFTSLDTFYVIRQRNWANVFVGKVANVDSDTSITLTRAAAATISVTGQTAGTGTIQARNSNREIIGSGTNFLYELDAGVEIYYFNAALPGWASLGIIDRIESNTSAFLTTFASANYGSTFQYNATPNWKYQIYSQAQVIFDPETFRFTDNPNRGNGNISIFTANSMIIGDATVFNKQLTVGAHIFGNTYTADTNFNSFLGVVERVIDNATAQFTSFSTYDLSNITYEFYATETQNKSNVFTKDQDVVTSSLIKWSRSGLIPNLKQVKAYHPPVQDPVTGVLVNFPASIHISNPSVDVLVDKEWKHLDETQHTSHSSVGGTTIDFDAETGAFNSSLRKAIDSIPINNFISKLAGSISVVDSDYASTLTQGIRMVYGDASIPTPPGITVASVPSGFTPYRTTTGNLVTAYDAYIGPGGNIVYKLNPTLISNIYPTICDTFAILGGINLPQRITDKKSDAMSYFSTSDLSDSLTEAQRSDLAARASKQFAASSKKKFVTTGCPAAIPGQLNVILMEENPTTRAFNVPEYSPEMVGLSDPPEYNKDLPISIANEPPFPL